uniref:Uncharacterized protein n=1 Tax=Timema douglasi TaxID=61478 RepID=A0A7R8Z418_TIMDO|nr:unnamed protein product [Timema douglasi]
MEVPAISMKRTKCNQLSAASTEPLTKIQAQDLILRLTDEERRALLSALQEFQSEKMKAEYEGQVIRTKEALDCDKTHTQIPSYSLTAVLFDTTGPRLSGSSLHLDLYCREHCQLAGTRWRSKFGRPSKLPHLGDVDPTGSYCPVPEDWLMRKYDDKVYTENCDRITHKLYCSNPGVWEHTQHEEECVESCPVLKLRGYQSSEHWKDVSDSARDVPDGDVIEEVAMIKFTQKIVIVLRINYTVRIPACGSTPNTRKSAWNHVLFSSLEDTNHPSIGRTSATLPETFLTATLSRKWLFPTLELIVTTPRYKTSPSSPIPAPPLSKRRELVRKMGGDIRLNISIDEPAPLLVKTLPSLV